MDKRKKCERQCHLCGKTSVYNMTQFSNWDESAKEFIIKHLQETPPSNASICKMELLEAQRHASLSSYIPKWKRESTKSTSTCMYFSCSKTSNDGKISKLLFAPSISFVASQALPLNPLSLYCCVKLLLQSIQRASSSNKMCILWSFSKTG